jgi:hypothetical protein
MIAADAASYDLPVGKVMIRLRRSYDLPVGKVMIAAGTASYDACGSLQPEAANHN